VPRSGKSKEADTFFSWDPAINVLNVRTLSQLAGDKIVVNSINPGLCHSELTRNAAGMVGILIG